MRVSATVPLEGSVSDATANGVTPEALARLSAEPASNESAANEEAPVASNFSVAPS